MQHFLVILKPRKGYKGSRGRELHTQMRSTTIPDGYYSNFFKVLSALAQGI